MADIKNLILHLNQEINTDFTEDIEPMLKITLKNMKEGMSFDEAFENAFQSINHTMVRLSQGTKRRYHTENILFEALYEKTVI